MSRESVDIVRRALDAYGREGLDGALGYYHPEIEWTSTDAYIEAATYRGREGVRRYLGSMAEEFEDLRIEPIELLRDGMVYRVRNYPDMAASLEAAGLSK